MSIEHRQGPEGRWQEDYRRVSWGMFTSWMDQILTAKSIPADAKRLALARLHARLRISEAWPRSPENTANGSPVATFHNRIDSSADADSSRLSCRGFALSAFCSKCLSGR